MTVHNPAFLWVGDHSRNLLWGEAHMEFTSCPRMLHSQPTGRTGIWTSDLHIQSPTCYPFDHHISSLHKYCPHCFGQWSICHTTGSQQRFSHCHLWKQNQEMKYWTHTPLKRTVVIPLRLRYHQTPHLMI